MSFRYSICNEAFEGWTFADACRAIRRIGYTGIEIAPFTLAGKPEDISKARRAELNGIIRSEGLEFVGLHWLMMSPQGLHVTTRDSDLRRRSWGHVGGLIELCGDLGPGGVLVFGSPKQRATTPGVSREEATSRMVEGLASIARQAEARGVTVLLEALPIGQCDVVQTLGEAVEIVKEIGSPAIQTMFDVHNAVDEAEPHAALIERYFPYIRHVHVNEPDGRHCGTGDYDYRPIFETLRRLNYTGWISLEAFDFTPGAERLAEESLRHLESQLT